MAISVSLHIQNSPTMATALRSPLRPFLSFHWRSSTHILRLQSSSSHPALHYFRVRYPSPSRGPFRVFQSRGASLFACVLKNEVAEPAPKDNAADEELQARGDSTMPERFRYLNKEIPDPPVRWPWAIGSVWRTCSFSAFQLQLRCPKKLLWGSCYGEAGCLFVAAV